MTDSFLQSEIESLQKRIMDTQNRIAGVETEIERNLYSQRDINRQLESHQRSLERCNNSLRNSYQRDIDADNRKLQELVRRNNSLNSDRKRYSDELRKLNAELSSSLRRQSINRDREIKEQESILRNQQFDASIRDREAKRQNRLKEKSAHNKQDKVRSDMRFDSLAAESRDSSPKKKPSSKKSLLIVAVICLLLSRVPLNENAEENGVPNNVNAEITEENASTESSTPDIVVSESISSPNDTQVSSEPHIHKYTNMMIQEASCTSDGVAEYSCSCGDSYEEIVEAYGHTTDTGRCSRCGYNFTNPIVLSGYGDYPITTDTIQIPHGVYQVIFTVDRNEESNNNSNISGWGMYINSGKVHSPEWTETDRAVMHGTVSTVWDFDSDRIDDNLYSLTFTINLCCDYKLEIVPIND